MNKQTTPIKSIDGRNLSSEKPKTQKFFTIDELEVGEMYYDSLSGQVVLIYETVKKSFKYFNKLTGEYSTSTPSDKQLFNMV